MGTIKRQPKAARFLRACQWKNNKAQSALEYAVVITCVVAALLVMQVYLKRAMQGRLREVADQTGQQYAPRNTTGNSTLTYNSQTHTVSTTKSEVELGKDLNGNGGALEPDVYGTETTSTLINSENTQSGSEHVGSLGNNLYE